VVYASRWSCIDFQYDLLVRINFPNLFTKAKFYSAQNVIKARRARGDRSRGALLGLVPFFVTWTLIPAYLYLNPEILHNHLVPFVFFAGLVNAYSVGQMITAHLVELDFPYYNVLVLPIAYGVFDSAGPFLQQTVGFGWPSALGDGGYQVAYLFSMLGMAIGVYGSFVVSSLLASLSANINVKSRSTLLSQSVIILTFGA
jgi:ethanolaminephosphotransferase